MTSRQRCELLNNPRVYRHTRGRLEEMGSCIGVSKKRNTRYGASHVCSLAVGAALQNRNLAGTAEAKRARYVVSAVPEMQNGVMSGETVRRTPDGACVDCTNRAFTCLTGSMPEDLWIMGALDPDMPMDIAPDKHYEIRYDRDPDEHLVRGITDGKRPVSKEMYIAAQCIVAGHRFVLACPPGLGQIVVCAAIRISGTPDRFKGFGRGRQIRRLADAARGIHKAGHAPAPVPPRFQPGLGEAPLDRIRTARPEPAPRVRITAGSAPGRGPVRHRRGDGA